MQQFSSGRNRRRPWQVVWLVAVAWAAPTVVLRAGQWEFTKIADANADVTGSGGFRGIQDASLRNGVIAFRSSGGVSGTLWQYYQGTFTPLLGPGALFPGTDQPFYSFDYTWADDEIWIGGRVANGPAGLFRWNQGQLVNLVPSGLADPLTQVPFRNLQTPLVQAPDVQGRIVFSGQYDANNSGIYRYSPSDHSVETILDRNTLVPGQTVPFNWLSRPVQLGDRVLFAGGNYLGQAPGGVYEWRDGQLLTVADRQSVLPSPSIVGLDFTPISSLYGYLGGDTIFTGQHVYPGFVRTLYHSGDEITLLGEDCLDPASCLDEWFYLYDLALDPNREAFATSSGGTPELQRLTYFADSVQETVLDGEQILYDLGPQFGVVPPEGDDLTTTGVGARISLQGIEKGAIAFTAVVENRELSLYGSALFLAIRVPEPATGDLLVTLGIVLLGTRLTPRLMARKSSAH